MNFSSYIFKPPIRYWTICPFTWENKIQFLHTSLFFTFLYLSLLFISFSASRFYYLRVVFNLFYFDNSIFYSYDYTISITAYPRINFLPPREVSKEYLVNNWLTLLGIIKVDGNIIFLQKECVVSFLIRHIVSEGGSKSMIII